MHFILVFLLALVGYAHLSSFYIDYDSNTFVKDSKPFRYVSGSIHSYRIPRALWQDRLNKMWTAGLNAIQIYIFWNEHEPQPGVYDFDGQNDIFAFIELAKSIGFVIILRPGPYVCAEHEYGGLPWWLLSNPEVEMIPRTSNPVYMNSVTRWFSVLLPKISPYLYKNGGPIITVQIENEYGSYYACDREYTSSLRDLFRSFLGDDVVYFTTDPDRLLVLNCGSIKDVYPTVDFGTKTDPSKAFALQRKFAPKGPLVNGNSVDYLKCGAFDGAYSTVDFGPGANVTASFISQRVYSPYGPLVNSEFYPGWLDIWGLPHSTVDTKSILSTFTEMMNMNANVNFYMFHGGTNFGFSNGADPVYETQPTSYDYDAPITEAGDTTEKYLAIRNSISKYLPVPQVSIPSNSSKIAYGKVQMNYHSPLVDAIIRNSNSLTKSQYPLTFEQLGQGYGFVLYKSELPSADVDGKILSIPGIRDRGYIQIGPNSLGYVYRATKTSLTINLKGNTNTTLYIIVENMGRLNYGNDMIDRKGIIQNVTLDNVILTGWEMYTTQNFIPNFQKNVTKYNDFLISNKENRNLKLDYSAPAIYTGDFMASNIISDTFLKMDQFTKGVAFVRTNTIMTNLGRYWPHMGPQVTLYVPGVFITPSITNTIVLVEFEGSSCSTAQNCYVELIDQPILNGPLINS